MNSKLVFEFNSVEELKKHVEWMSDLENIKLLMDKPQRKEFDQRGLHITALHEKARAYHIAHPDIKYHQCMKIISKPNGEIA